MSISPINSSSNLEPSNNSNSNVNGQILFEILALSSYVAQLLLHGNENNSGLKALISKIFNLRQEIQNGQGSPSQETNQINELINELNEQIGPNIPAYPNNFAPNELNGQIQALINFINLTMPDSPLAGDAQNILNQLDSGKITQQQAAQLLLPIIDKVNETYSYPSPNPSDYPDTIISN